MVSGEEVRVLMLVWLVVSGFGENIFNQKPKPETIPASKPLDL